MFLKFRWMFPKMVVPNNHGFSYKKWSFWGVLGDPLFLETTRWVQMIFPGRFVGSTRRSKSSSKVKWIYDPKPHAMVIAPYTVLRCMVTMRWWRPCCWRRQMWKNAMMKVGIWLAGTMNGEVWSPGFLITFFFGGMDVDICFFLPWKGNV